MSLILGVVDDESTRQALKDAFNSPEYELILTDTNTSFLPMLEQEPVTLVIIDADPDQDIDQLCHQIRPYCAAPVLFLLSEDCERSIPETIKAGASDCIVKPLRVPELRARAQAAIYRNEPRDGYLQPVLRCGRLNLNLLTRRVFKDGKEVSVTATGYRMLVYLMQHQQKVVSKEELLREVWGYSGSMKEFNLVESAIKRLRKDIGDDPKKPDCLHTVWGSGYRFEEM